MILAAGRGTRLRPLTPTTPKALAPLLNRPLIAYAFDLLAALGIAEAAVVLDGDDETVRAITRVFPAGLPVTIARQIDARGPADALAMVGEQLAHRDVVVIAVDTVIPGGMGLLPLWETFRTAGAARAIAMLPLHTTDRPREMGIAILDRDRIVDLEEKPAAPRSNLASVGIWMLAPAAIERIRTRPVINAKGEADLTGTVAALLREGHPVAGGILPGDWLDGGSLAGLLDAQAYLLRAQQPAPPVPAGVTLQESTLVPPVLVGDGAFIERCDLGPDVVVGAGARLHNVRLSDALICPGARLEGGEYAGVVVTATSEVVPVR